MKRRFYLIIDINNYKENEMLSDRLVSALKKYIDLYHKNMGKSNIAQIGNDLFNCLMTFDDEEGFEELKQRIECELVRYEEESQ